MPAHQISPNLLWQIVLLRGMGLSEREVARRVSGNGQTVRQETISYHLRKLRDMVEKENEYLVLQRVIQQSDRAKRYLSQISLSPPTATG
jgi:hypothetical protein